MLPNAEDTPRSTLPPVKKCRNRRKTHVAWEQTNRDSNGLFAHNAEALARKFRKLTPMELRVCAMAKEMLPSWLIAQKLGISERTVESHRLRIRHKMKIRLRKPLTSRLLRI
jgi:DNA-binding CsgD family transcriptional regulator